MGKLVKTAPLFRASVYVPLFDQINLCYVRVANMRMPEQGVEEKDAEKHTAKYWVLMAEMRQLNGNP